MNNYEVLLAVNNETSSGACTQIEEDIPQVE